MSSFKYRNEGRKPIVPKITPLDTHQTPLTI